MRFGVVFRVATVTALFCAGCQSPAPQPSPTTPPPVSVQKSEAMPALRKRTPEQVQMLLDFAQKESPKIFSTVQTMRGEIRASGEGLKKLRTELLEFDRNPDADEDYKALLAGLMELKSAYDAIFDRLEDAYIAAKKYEASPSRKDYQDTMKRALEDGIQDATMATERYKAMTRMKCP